MSDHRCFRAASAALLLTFALGTAGAQQTSAPRPPATAPAAQVAMPPARPADVESIDAIMAAVYDVISGPAGQVRDWDRFRSLFIPDARLIPTGKRPDGTRTIRTLSVDEYARNIGPQLERGGFFERELGRKVERYGNVVHLMSAYDSKRTLADPAPFARGVNSFQLWYDGSRWYVVTICWEAESAENPIPAEWIRKP
jgi:hypothetical protein